MHTYIQDWLGSTLGIVIDLSPSHFGRHTKDGRLLAKLLYSYGAIPLQIYNSVKSSKHVNDCYNNLKILKPWLEYLEVPIKDEDLYDIASGQGTAAFQLFCALYLSLQHKDRLHYFSVQKERRYTQEYTKRQIKVAHVPEKCIIPELVEPESDLASPLITKKYMIDKHREKCNEILQKIKSIKNNYAKALAETPKLGPIISVHPTTKKLSKLENEIASTEHDLKAFSDKHVQPLPDLNYEELIELQSQVNALSPKPIPNFKDAAGYMNFIKQKTKRGLIIQTFQERMQNILIDDVWANVRTRQDGRFEETVCRNLLKQSQYEKQMCTKLALMRRQKDVLMKNREMIDGIITKNLIQKEYDDNLQYEMDIAAEDALGGEFERQRQLELHKRMYIEKVRLKYKERQEEARSVLFKLIDIAIRISDFRECFSCEIPKHLMKDIKELFFKDLPIFDILEDVTELYRVPVCIKEVERDVADDYEEVEEEEILGEDDMYGEDDRETFLDELVKMDCNVNEDVDSTKAAEMVRQEVLNECDFNDYMFLLGPWMAEVLIPDGNETEVSQLVLGYIVHKMLECKYPQERVSLPAEIKPMHPRAIVQGSSDTAAFEMLRELMELRRILVVRVDDAINFVLRAYKDELSAVRDVDITFHQATKNALKGKGGPERTKDQSKKEQLLKKDVVMSSRLSVIEPNCKEVGTQTPRKIPDDDPPLSPNAEIGKSAFEALGIGDPVPDMAVISAIIAYVISLQETYDGWVLWNYPVLYSQASKLEFALTGYHLISINDEMDTVEGLEGFSCRSNCQNSNDPDEFAEKRISRLVPKPEGSVPTTKAESYFTSFVRLRKKIDGESTVPRSSTSMAQPHGQDFLEMFYTEQEIYFCLDYTSINFQKVKDVGKVLLNHGEGADKDITAKPSVEVFGAGVTELNEKYNPPKKKDPKKNVETPKKGKNEAVVQADEPGRIAPETEIKTDKAERMAKKGSVSTQRDIKPGDPTWEWATGQQSEEIQLTLASFWERLEAVFVEDFKNIFFCLRVHRAKTMKYKAFLKKAMQRFMRREDDKQCTLNEFQHKFNEIDDDLRPDADVKCELHVRVSELEEVLLEMADSRRLISEHYRVKSMNDNWVSDELANLVNLYMRALQLEADRCIDTCQFINDYYMSLQQKIPPETVLTKVCAPTLLMKERSYSVISEISKSLPSNVNRSWHTSSKTSKVSFRRARHEKTTGKGGSRAACGTIPQEATVPDGTETISYILETLTFPQDGSTPYHTFFLDAVASIKGSVKTTVEACLSEVRKSTAGAAVVTAKDKKKTAEVKPDATAQAAMEWITALETELTRFLFRIQLIQMRAVMDFNDFILTVLNTLVSLSTDIGDIYNKEVFSISECCKVFRCAIEEEVAVQPRLELNVDEFIINHSFPLFQNLSVDLTANSTLSYFKLQFTIEQLTVMANKLQYIAPDGEIIRRAFLYILEDLRVMKSEDGKPRLLPDVWNDLNPNDLPFIFDRIYQRIEIVNWKDFIVHALEVPMPTEAEILMMLSNFRAADPCNTELISLKLFVESDFWFENYATRFDNCELKEFLFKLYQVNENQTNYTALLLALCKDEDPLSGFVKALALAVGKRIIVDHYDDLESQEGEQEDIFEEDESYSHETSDSDKTKASELCKRCVRYPCQCKEPSEPRSVTPMDEEHGEAYGLFFGSKDSLRSLSTSEVSREVVKKVLLAAYPSFPQLSILLSCRIPFEQSVDAALSSLNEEGCSVRISKLLKHKFIYRILTNTNKFKTVDLQSVLKSIVGDRLGNKRSTCSLTWS